MPSGFDATALNTGLLNSIASQNNAATRKAQEELEYGDKAQVQAFQDAAREYNAEKQKKSDQGTKIDALANIISSGSPNPAAYAAARDAVEAGYTNAEHLPYVIDAYKRTMQDYMQNPEKWTGVKKSADPEWDERMGNYIQDTNPSQTAALRRSGNQQDISDIEGIRQRNLPNPHSELPGAKWNSDPNAIFSGDAGKTYATTMAGQQAQLDSDKQRSEGLAQNLGLGQDQNAQSPVSSAMPGQAQGQTNSSVNPIAVDEASLAPPPAKQQVASAPQAEPAVNTQEGISIAAPAPPETNGGPQTQQTAQVQPPATAASPAPQLGNKEGQINPVTQRVIHIDPSTHLDEGYLASIKGGPVAQGMVRQIANYDIMPPTQSMRPDAKGQPSAMFEYLLAAKGANPDFSMTNYKALVGLKSQYIDPNGTAQKQYQAIGTGLNHLGMLQQAGKALAQNDLQAMNTLANKAGAALGQDPLTTYKAIQQRLAPEIVSAYVKGGGDLNDRIEAGKTLSDSLSSSQREGVLSATAHLLYGKLVPLNYTWDQNFPNEAGKDFIPPNAHAVLKGMGVDENDKTPYLTQQKQGQNLNTPQQNQPQKDYSHVWMGTQPPQVSP